jgi:hypothetical protein
MLARYQAEATGTLQVLEAKAEGYRRLVAACAENPQIAPTLLLIEEMTAGWARESRRDETDGSVPRSRALGFDADLRNGHRPGLPQHPCERRDGPYRPHPEHERPLDQIAHATLQASLQLSHLLPHGSESRLHVLA